MSEITTNAPEGDISRRKFLAILSVITAGGVLAMGGGIGIYEELRNDSKNDK